MPRFYAERMRIPLKVLHHHRRSVEVEVPGVAGPVALTRCLDTYLVPEGSSPVTWRRVEIWQDAARLVTLRLSRLRGSGDDWAAHLWA